MAGPDKDSKANKQPETWKTNANNLGAYGSRPKLSGARAAKKAAPGNADSGATKAAPAGKLVLKPTAVAGKVSGTHHVPFFSSTCCNSEHCVRA